jgi:hypothetical protein
VNHEHGDGVMTVQQQADLGQQALRAFERDLPRLWGERPAQWVAYKGEHLLGFAAQQHELYHDCFQKGLSRGEFVVFCIEPLEIEILIGPQFVD